jgi:hypothetical protein
VDGGGAAQGGQGRQNGGEVLGEHVDFPSDRSRVALVAPDETQRTPNRRAPTGRRSDLAPIKRRSS